LSLGVDVVVVVVVWAGGFGRVSSCCSVDAFVGLVDDVGGTPNKSESRSSRDVCRRLSSVEGLFVVVSDSMKKRIYMYKMLFDLNIYV